MIKSPRNLANSPIKRYFLSAFEIINLNSCFLGHMIEIVNKKVVPKDENK